MKLQFDIDGNKIQSESDFYDEIEKQLTLGLDWKIGRNLDAFNDILRGGFGAFDYGDKILLKWCNYKNSESMLDQEFLNIVLEIISEHANVELMKL